MLPSASRYLDIAPDVSHALRDGQPVVALESTIISHGMPWPENVETALRVERTVRDNGAVPATIAILGGRLKPGLTTDEIRRFGERALRHQNAPSDKRRQLIGGGLAASEGQSQTL